MEVKIFDIFLKSGVHIVLPFFLLYMLMKLEKSFQELVKEMKEIKKDYVRKESCISGDITRRLSEIEKDTLKRSEFYRDFSGWRAEINRVEDKVDQLKDLIISRGD